MRRIVSVLFVTFLSIGVILGSEASGSAPSESPGYRLVREDRIKIRGILEEIGRGFIIVEGLSYKTASNLMVKGKEGELISNGIKGLSRSMMIELVLEDHLVVQIQIVSLPR